MSKKSPIFPISQLQQFTDYGFDPQIDYFQVLEEAMKHKEETTRNIDAIQFKLQKPISKDDSKKKKWWKNALFFFKRSWIHNRNDYVYEDVHQVKTQAFRTSISGPVYITESRSGSTTPYRTTSRSYSGPLRKGEMEIPYLSLRELIMEQQPHQNISFPAMPIYLVT